jgi:hypothetical protein
VRYDVSSFLSTQGDDDQMQEDAQDEREAEEVEEKGVDEEEEDEVESTIVHISDSNNPSIDKPECVAQTPWLHQLQAVYALDMREHNVLELKPFGEKDPMSYKRINCTILEAPPGTGKTLTALMLAVKPRSREEEDSCPFGDHVVDNCQAGGLFATRIDSEMLMHVPVSLVIVPRMLLEQWYEAMHKAGLPEEMVWKFPPECEMSENVVNEIKGLDARFRTHLQDPGSEPPIPRVLLMTLQHVASLHKAMWFDRVIVDEPEMLAESQDKLGASLPRATSVVMLTGSAEKVNDMVASANRTRKKIPNPIVGYFKHLVAAIKDSKWKVCDVVDRMTIKVDACHALNSFIVKLCEATRTLHTVANSSYCTIFGEHCNQGTSGVTNLLGCRRAMLMQDYTMVRHYMGLVPGSTDGEVEFHSPRSLTAFVKQQMDDNLKANMEGISRQIASMGASGKTFSAKTNANFAKIQLSNKKTIMDLTNSESGADLPFNDKMSTLKSLLDSFSGPKCRIVVLIFSRYNCVAIREKLLHMRATWDMVDFSVPMDANTHKNYITALKQRQARPRAVLVNPKHYGRGLNYEFASHVIIMHGANYTELQQWIGRAQRPGRHGALDVHIILAKDEDVEQQKQLVENDHFLEIGGGLSGFEEEGGGNEGDGDDDEGDDEDDEGDDAGDETNARGEEEEEEERRPVKSLRVNLAGRKLGKGGGAGGADVASSSGVVSMISQ